MYLCRKNVADECVNNVSGVVARGHFNSASYLNKDVGHVTSNYRGHGEVFEVWERRNRATH